MQAPQRPLQVRGQPLAGGRLPAVCAPLVARTRDDLLAEAASVAALQPDLLEWRVDFFDARADAAAVVDTAAALRRAAGGIPLLFTRRSPREGGQACSLGEAQVAALCRAVCESGHADLLDFEMASEPAHVAAVRDSARTHGVGLVLSFHDFHATPSLAQLAQRFALAHELGADVAKVAVMPGGPEDVLRLMQATLQASRALPIPVVSMAMGPWGAVSRLCGGVFGSALSFAVGRSSSAPGQIPIADMRAGLDILARAMGRA